MDRGATVWGAVLRSHFGSTAVKAPVALVGLMPRLLQVAGRSPGLHPLHVTTLILHGLPSRRGMDSLLAIVEDLGFDIDASFDFFYLPRRSNHKNGRCANYGYIFINCRSPGIAAQFARVIQGHSLGRKDRYEWVFCQTATVQGVYANLCQNRGGAGHLLFADEKGSWSEVVNDAVTPRILRASR